MLDYEQQSKTGFVVPTILDEATLKKIEEEQVVSVPIHFNPKMDFDLNIASYEAKKELHEKTVKYNDIITWMSDNLSTFSRPDLGIFCMNSSLP